MDLWERLTASAVLGTDRQLVDLAAEGQLGAMLAKLREQDKEHQLLGAAAVVSLYRRAGTALPMDGAPLPTPAPVDGWPECPHRARECLAAILSASQGDGISQVLPEWLALLRESGARAPEDYLPELLELGRQHGALREAIAAVAGERGKWLGQRHPGWAYVAGETDTADFAIRRRRDPAQAREELAAEWPALDTEARESRLAALAIGLSMDDEPLLESALDDKRKEVRSAAADLLARLPHSRFADRMRERLEPLLAFTPPQSARIFPPSAGSKVRFDITPPAACDKAMQRDGIQAKMPVEVSYQLNELGEKGWWLLQMIGFLPPGYWCERWGQTPDQLLMILQGNDWRDAVQNGWTQAAVRFRDQAWAKALYPLTLTSNGFLVNWTDLMNFLPPAYWEEVTVKALFGKQADTEMLPQVVGLLSAYPYPWSAQLTAAVWKRLQELLKTTTFREDMWTLFSGSLTAFAEKSPASFLPEAIDNLRGVPSTIPESSFRRYWVKTIESAISLLQLRLTMHQAFNKDG